MCFILPQMHQKDYKIAAISKPIIAIPTSRGDTEDRGFEGVSSGAALSLVDTSSGVGAGDDSPDFFPSTIEPTFS